MMEWLCTQERWNSEVVIVFGTAARYRQDIVGSSHDDAHSDNSALHTGAVRPHSGFVKKPLHIAPYGPSFASEQMLSAFLFISLVCAFRAEHNASIFLSVPVEAVGGGGNLCPASMGT